MSAPGLRFLASAPRGCADLLAAELVSCGATGVRERATGVAFEGSLEAGYRACLWSRVANRVFLELARFEAADAAAFYTGVRRVDWTAHLAPGATLACEFSGRHPAITHSHFGALKVKDGIVDTLREATGARPDIAPERPDVRVHAHAQGPHITLSLDLSGDSLHRRGYRGGTGEAPLKENVAAGVLLRAGWPQLALRGVPFLDPMCGSGTFCIEAALMATDHAPGLLRSYFGFSGWRGHDAALWTRLVGEARQRAAAGASGRIAPVHGSDCDARAIRAAQENAGRAGVKPCIAFEVRSLDDAVAPAAAQDPATAAPADPADRADPARAPPAGLLCTNPPYGVRLEDREAARALHRELGQVLRAHFAQWSVAIITAPELGMELGLRAWRTHAMWNGALECRLLRIRVDAASERSPGTLGKGTAHLKDTAGAQMFSNRLGKNIKRLRGWAQREQVSCYRLYDADMPEYAFAIDLYQTVEPQESWLYVQEYAAPAQIEAEAVRRRRGEVLASLPGATGVAPERIRLRTRKRMRGSDQYDRRDEQREFLVVAEGGLKFRVNLEDYLDTGLFLDHRLTRARLRAASAGKRFLNLFGYTGSATVYAAAGGARSSATVDMSRPYLAWAQRNLALNGLADPQHEFIQADCIAWLEEAGQGAARYDLVFLDPPTFSNSARMSGVLDTQRDHPALLDACARLLAPDGLIVFSTNAQRFRLADEIGTRFQVTDLSAATLPQDFARNPRIHRCYELRPRV
ncbi:MAG: bifunctional 23S rRNA (guanine(2069)-N(7))-methyltransferase RlmK/23S rRNA (guanine(2445)-N(2))-methyltransferase RlmL [Proteobacteria bacterium]|nr:bifunctional 23S rRNA (guanine(2069)-N(7))-methyltransferase RlmK/23S rRNA (guanine(2445)-N(2))-methyltransferase RlmL [Pseudomonadota bacterium]